MLKEVNSSQIFEGEQPSQLEISLAEFDKVVEQKKALDRLLANPDFQTVIVDGYLEEDFHRLADLLKNNKVNKRVVEEDDIIKGKIQAKGYLENWIEVLIQTTAGIDNPEHRIALLKQLVAAEEEAEQTEGGTK